MRFYISPFPSVQEVHKRLQLNIRRVARKEPRSLYAPDFISTEEGIADTKSHKAGDGEPGTKTRNVRSKNTYRHGSSDVHQISEYTVEPHCHGIATCG